MSRVGKAPVKVLSGVKVQIQGRQVHIEGPKGKLSHTLPEEGVTVKLEADQLQVLPEESAGKRAGALQGVTRTVLDNMVKGVHTGFKKELDVVGVGYRAAVKGEILNLTLGFSHPIDYSLPTGITAKVEKNTHIVLEGADKVLLGRVAAEIRDFRPPEPYQGKGVKYSDERIIRKAGKAAGSK